MANQFNIIKYVNSLEISQENKIMLEKYTNSDEFEKDTEKIDGTIDEKCKEVIQDKIENI